MKDLETCPQCQKVLSLCLCKEIQPVENKIKVLVLQHPREQDRELGTAALIKSALKNSEVKIGLSWANLQKAWGAPVDPKRWAVLYLGTGVKVATGAQATEEKIFAGAKTVQPLEVGYRPEGIVILDGSWSQAKALWWRNAWILKLRRLVVQPKRPSLYGKLRKEPRKEALSSIESLGDRFALDGRSRCCSKES